MMAQIATGAVKIAAKRVGVSVEQYQEAVAAGKKWCRGCRAFAGRENFGVDSSRGDGLASVCKPCKNRRGRQGYVFRDRKRGRRFVAARDGDKEQARRRVNYLVESGLIPHPSELPCTDCHRHHPTSRHEYDHHLGYDAEHHESVQPVCAPCHHKRESARVQEFPA